MFKNNKLFIAGIFIISFISVLFMMYLTRNCCFWGDDSFYTQYGEGEPVLLSLNFNFIHGAGYIGLFLCKFVSSKIPLLLGIHPNDFLCTQCGIIRGILTAIIILMISAFSIIHKKSKLLYFIVFIFTFLYFYNAAFASNVILINYNWWRYFFSLLFVSIFLFYLFKNSTGKKEIIIASLSAFVIGTATEINILNFLYFVILIILFRLRKGFSTYIPVCFLFLAVFLFMSSPVFQDVAVKRGIPDVAANLLLIKDFCVPFWEIYFQNEWFYWLIFIILTVCCFIFAIKKQEVKEIIIPLLYEISVVLAIFSLIICGKTCPIENSYDFFLKHMNIIFLYKMLILYPLYVYISYLYSNTNEKIKYAVCIILLILSAGIVHKQYINRPFYYSDIEFKEYKKNAYMLQKIAYFYYLKNETPEIPPELESDAANGNWLSSMALIYKNPKILDLKYKVSDDALEKYYANGGTFSEEELEKLKFSDIFKMN